MTDTLSREINRLGELRQRVDDHLAILLPDAGETPRRVHAAMRYAVLSPGKRIRPVLTLLCAEALGCAVETAMPAACALELVHAASLVLDDLPCMDDAPTRRGLPTVHVRYGQGVAVLTGVALLNEAYGLLTGAEMLPAETRLAMTGVLSRTVGTAGLVGGQEKDLRPGAEPSLAFLSELHHEKTGVLFVASVEMAILAAQAPEPAADALRRFALELGLAFQALDDLQDEDDLADGRGGVNLLSVLGRDGLRSEAEQRLQAAQRALADGGPRLRPLVGCVDALLGRS